MAKKKRLRCWVKFAIVIILLLIAYVIMVNVTPYRVSVIKLDITPGTTVNEFDNGDFDISNTGELSVSFWINSENISFNESYLELIRYGDENNTQWEFRLYNQNDSKTNRYSFIVYDGVENKSLESTILGDENESELVNVVGIIDGNFTSIYKNGILIDKKLYVDYNFSENEYKLFVNSLVSKISIYNRTLNQSEINSLYLK